MIGVKHWALVHIGTGTYWGECNCGWRYGPSDDYAETEAACNQHAADA